MSYGLLAANSFPSVLGVFSLGMPELAVCIGAAAVLPALFLWLIMRGRAQQMRAESAAAAEKLKLEAAAELKAAQVKAATQHAEVSQRLAEVSVKLMDVEQRFTTYREVADRRQTEASQQIDRLEADLASTREVAAQLPPTQARIKDLETALAAEQGRVQAQTQAITATNARALDFEKRMIEAQELVMRHQKAKQEAESELKKIRDEQASYAAAGGPEAELAKAREANQQLEVKMSNLQRVLKAAEARVEMVQKEFMNAVGLDSAPTPGASTPASSDKKLRELEEKLTQLEAESRKRAREDGYKIAELEYRLSEALEAARPPAEETPETEAVEPPAPAKEISDPPPVEDSPAAATDEEGAPAVAVPDAATIAPPTTDRKGAASKMSAECAAARKPSTAKSVAEKPATPEPAVGSAAELPHAVTIQ